MKRKSTKNKSEEKTHKSSRRKRKSSSSESDEGESSEVQIEPPDDTRTRRSRKSEKDVDNSIITGGGRVTRHSRRLAAISASSDEVKETTPELHSPAKTGKSSPFSGSPVKDSKRKDGTPDKHKGKDSVVWQVKAANSSTGEIGKLKICRQRSPDIVVPLEEPDVNNKSVVVEKGDEKPVNYVEMNLADIALPAMKDDIANIQLPPADPVESLQFQNIYSGMEGGVTFDESVEIQNIELPPEPKPQPTTDMEGELQPVVERKEHEQQSVVELVPKPELVVEAVTEPRTVEEVIPAPQIIAKPVPEAEPVAETVPERQPVIETVLVTHAAMETEPVSELSVRVEPEKNQSDGEILKVQENMTQALSQSKSVVEKGASPAVCSNEIDEKVIETTKELEKSVIEKPKEQSQPEQEDNFQAELVLTVEDNVMEEQTGAMTGECDDNESASKERKEPSKTVSILPSLKQVEMEEVYDYEHDDTKEEGELSATEAMSPIHEVFKKYSAGERKRSWGTCNVFHFSRSNTIANEQVLKSHNIKKCTVSKDDLESSDTEDLIFVKEIREENIVHDIESETNNTSFNDKDIDDSSPVLTGENIEVRRKNTLESDKISDRLAKRYSKESSRTVISGDGRSVLFITNLVRPFTVTQLRELLQRTGKIVEDGFWIDSIKSKCYVQFENEDQANETRHALHGIRWPVNNPKVLNVQYATVNELIAAQVHTDELEIPRKTEPLVVSNHNSDVQKRIDWKKHFEQYDERPRKLKDVREWDIGKPAHPDEMIYEDVDDPKKKDENDITKSKRDKKRRHGTPDDDPRVKRNKKAPTDNQPPTEAKLLDDLFRRTKASPSIYWLPLSDEQIAIKQEARRKHLEDINKQMKRGNDRDPRRRERDREPRRSRR